jgi:hypothetical protein
VTWVTWRLYRGQWAIALALLAAFAAVELVDGLHMAAHWHSLLTTCPKTSAVPDTPQCLNKNIVSLIGNDLRVLSVIVPAVLGMLWGAPLVAHEMESGMTSFAWTQGVTRNRWLAVKAGIMLAAAALWAGAVSALVTWWSGPENAQRGEAFMANFFDTQGINPIGYAVFATALGITIGALLRRTLPAIAVTLGGFIGVRALVDSAIRPHLMPTVTTVVSMSSTWSPPGISWVYDSATLAPNGQSLTGGGPFGVLNFNGQVSPFVPQACQKLVAGSDGRIKTFGPFGQDTVNAFGACLDKAGFRQYFTYQPGSRYWAFQGIEAGIYVVLAAILLAVTFWVLKRRDA